MSDSSDSSAVNNLSKPMFPNKAAQELQYRDWLLDDLLNQRTFFRSGPYEAHVQFSNFCNMSCIMCWDGRNPPPQKTSPEMLQLIGEQIAPHLSVITPYSGSEPLVLSWDETRDMAREHSILLCITTNCQYLDEARFHELKDITETLLLSIDSHIPEVFEIIRPGGNVEKVFANLKTTARLAREHRIECIVNIVLMTHNAPHLAETIEYLGDLGIESVNVIQMLDVNNRSQYYDPLQHFSQEYIAWVKQRCLKAVEAQQMRLIWSVAGCTKYDFRPADHVQPLERKSWSDYYDYRMKRIFPGFCRNVFNRLRVDSAGDVAPCCYAVEGELSLGNLQESSFDEIWNGPSAQDLRRGMMCGDVPALCSSCRYIDPVAPQPRLEFLAVVDDQLQHQHQRSKDMLQTDLSLVAPNHGQRLEQPPEFCIAEPQQPTIAYHVALSLGGETEEVRQATIDPIIEDGVVRLKFPQEIWETLRTNVGYWWSVWAVPADSKSPILRSKNALVLLRHEALPRLAGSRLKYKDKGSLPVIDLGVAKQQGWTRPEVVPDRPTVDPKQFGRQQTDPLSTGDVGASNSPDQGGFWQRLLPSINFRSDENKARNSNVRDGYLDNILLTSDYLFLGGWVLLKDGPADLVEFHALTEKSVAAKRVIRPDLESSFPDIPQANRGGFEVKLRSAHFKIDTGYEFFLVTHSDGEIASRLHVKINATEQSDLPRTLYWFGGSERLEIDGNQG